MMIYPGLPEQRMRRPPTYHVTHQLQVPRRLGVDHHSPFDLYVSDSERRRGETQIEFCLSVFEEGTCS